jgi:hypothetical protein
MFQALLAHPQEMLHKWNLVYCVPVIVSWLHHDWSGTVPVPLQSWCSQLTQHACQIPSAVYAEPLEELFQFHSSPDEAN